MKLDSEIWTDDNKLSRVFTWLSRIGASPKFGSRPIGWYQQHQCACIEYLEKVVLIGNLELRCKGGMIQAKIQGSWVPQVSAISLFDKADNKCRTGNF